MSPVPALLVLEDGRVFRGRSFGAPGEAFGELVLATGSADYQAVLTDPINSGRVVLATTTHVGNAGWNGEDSRSERVQAAGLIVRDPAPRPSNFRSISSLAEVLQEQGVVAIADIDTRALTHHLRALGTVRVGISTDTDDVAALLARVRNHSGKDA
ncbi:MAG: carbamoyl-phosphate synthase domain-containing protein [Propionibacteriaceae bacterium]|nr:carbamoyl-phosphate synthase domain-containing protein [Propionibacteriaceae bacterium]